MEYVTLENAQLEDVMASPTTFLVPLGEVSEAWERAHLFFNQYSPKGAQEQVTDAGLVLASRPDSEDKYLFSITRLHAQDGADFQVRCVAVGDSADPTLATRNAHNVARFLREGTLELELLAR